jgi:hypothetical protein
MAPAVVFVEPDPFLGSAKRAADYIPSFRKSVRNTTDTKQAAANVNYGTVSRPLSGIQIKPNTHATVEIKTAAGDTLKVLNRLGRETEDGQPLANATKASGEPNSDVWTDWLLQGVHEERAEKTQIVETFGDTYLYSYGQRPRVLAFTGLLLNTSDYNWRAIFWENWDKYFRATQLMRANARMYIYFDEILVEGYPLNAAADQSVSDNSVISFNFSFFVTNYINLTAESGFEEARNNITEIAKAGYADAVGEFSYLAPSKRLVNLLPGSSAVGVATNALLFSNASDSLANAINIASGTSSAKQMTSAPLSAALGQLALWREQGIAQFEQSNGLVRGDVNTWFGFLSQILEDKAPIVANNPASRFFASGEVSKPLLSRAVQLGLDPSNALGEGAKAYGIFVTT